MFYIINHIYSGRETDQTNPHTCAYMSFLMSGIKMEILWFCSRKLKIQSLMATIYNIYNHCHIEILFNDDHDDEFHWDGADNGICI